MKPFLSTNHLTSAFPLTKLILCTLPHFLRETTSKWSFLGRFSFHNYKRTQTPSCKLGTVFLRCKNHSRKLLKCPEKFISPFQNIHIQTVNKYSSGTTLQVWKLERKAEWGAQLLPRKSVLSRINLSTWLFWIAFETGRSAASLDAFFRANNLCLSKLSGLSNRWVC